MGSRPATAGYQKNEFTVQVLIEFVRKRFSKTDSHEISCLFFFLYRLLYSLQRFVNVSNGYYLETNSQ